MPAFGEYITEDKPLFTKVKAGHARTYWRATRPGAKDERVYFIKSVDLHPSGTVPKSATSEPVSTDLSADFFEGITRLQAVSRSHAELFAPICAFGRTERELWYATDYYERQSLTEYQSTAADINDRTLRQVVYSVASASLALQQAVGRAHGNLTTSNILVGGEPGPLRLSPLRLTDVAGSSLILASGNHSPRGGNADLVIRDATELRDLRSIGWMILKLVQNELIQGPDDYTLPIEPSYQWNVLGDASQWWLDLCNLLLDPNLSLQEFNLQSVVRECKPSSRPSRVSALVAGLGLVLLAGIVYYPLQKYYPAKTSARTHGTQQLASAQSPVSPGKASVAVSEGPTGAEPRSALQGGDDQPQLGADLPQSMGPTKSPPTSERIPSSKAIESEVAGSRPRTSATEINGTPVTASVPATASPTAGVKPNQPSVSPSIESSTLLAGGLGTSRESQSTVQTGVGQPNPVSTVTRTDASRAGGSNFSPTNENFARQTANTTQAASPTPRLPTTEARNDPQQANTEFDRTSASANLRRVDASQRGAVRAEKLGPPAQNLGSPKNVTPKSTEVLAAEKRVLAQEQIRPGEEDVSRLITETQNSARQMARAEPKATNSLTPPTSSKSGRSEKSSAPPGEQKVKRPFFAPLLDLFAKNSSSPSEQAQPKTGQRENLGAMQTRSSTPRNAIDTAQLDKQLRELESDVARIVALPRNSEYFTQLDSLESQYAKADQLTAKTKKRLDMLRATMAKKVPGVSSERVISRPVDVK